jgi:hypothetical protein
MRVLKASTLLGFLFVSIAMLQAKYPNINEGNGLMGHYYQNYLVDTADVIIFDGLTEVFTQIDTVIDFWDGGSNYRWQPVSGYGDHYSVQWKGYIYIEEAGQYGFGTISDDGSQIFIDSALIVDNGEEQWYDWEDNMGESDTSNTPFIPLLLDSGVHEILITFYEDRYYDGIELWWFKPGPDTSDIPYYGKNFSSNPPTYNPNTTWEIIPKSVLYSSLDSVTAIKFSERQEIIPGSVTLFQNYPNPFNPTTTIEYFIAKSGFVSIKVYNLLGEEMERLENKFKDVGKHKINFNGNKYPSGIYFYELKTSGQTITKSMLLLR